MQADSAFRGPGEVTGGQACSPGQPALACSLLGSEPGLAWRWLPLQGQWSRVLGRVPPPRWAPFRCTQDAGGGAGTPTAPFCGPRGVLCPRRPLLPGTPPFSHSELGNARGGHCSGAALDRRGDAGESGETEAQFSPGALVNARPHLGAPTCLPLPTLSPPDSRKIDTRSWNT